MLVVVPICQKDWMLAVRNLEWLAKGSKQNHVALVAFDEKLEEQSMREVRNLAGQVFQDVRVYCYDSPHTDEWPLAANHAWQSVARYVYHKFRGEHWLWWEADATPISHDWLALLDEAYVKSGSDMAGHVVMGLTRHMNGVGIYKWDVMERGPHAMTTRNAAFDVVLASEAGDRQFPINHLIYHFPRANGFRVSFTDRIALEALQSNGYVLFHGCTDGTLVDLLQGKEPKIEDTKGIRFFTKDDIGAPLDEAETHFQKEYVRIRKKGWDCVPLDEVRREAPRVQDQTDWPVGYFDFPYRRGHCFFNPGITRDGNGQRWLVVREWVRRGPKDWASTLHACELGKNLEIISAKALPLTNDPFEQNEDPRVVWHEGRFYVSFCQWNQLKVYHAKQCLAEFDENWKLHNIITPPYGWNDPDKLLPEVNACEKNWVFLSPYQFVYSFSPHVVCSRNVGSLTGSESQEIAPTEDKTYPQLLWRYGEIRGGTPPVRVGDEYVTFFHSSLQWFKKRKRYFVGAYCFEAKPPFKVTRITTEPLLRGSEADENPHESPLCVFAGGALFEKDHWLVTFGSNDYRAGWMEIPHADLIERMMPCN